MLQQRHANPLLFATVMLHEHALHHLNKRFFPQFTTQQSAIPFPRLWLKIVETLRILRLFWQLINHLSFYSSLKRGRFHHSTANRYILYKLLFLFVRTNNMVNSCHFCSFLVNFSNSLSNFFVHIIFLMRVRLSNCLEDNSSRTSTLRGKYMSLKRCVFLFLKTHF